MSIFALSITPYITSSIIMQLLTIAIPKLEELQKDGEDGRKKIAEYTRYLTVGMALFESCAMAVGLGGKGLLLEDHRNVWGYLTVVAAMTAGSALLMWIGERITDNGVGNGISIVLLINIVSGTPQDMITLYERFMAGKSVAVATVACIIVLAIIIAIVVFVLVLNDAERRIPVQYSKKMQGRRMIGGQSTYIPLKVNTANVIPVIFASSIMSMPVMIAQFFHVDYSTTFNTLLREQATDPSLFRGYQCVLFPSVRAMETFPLTLDSSILQLPCDRVFNHMFLDKIIQIPPHERVYLVNDDKYSTLAIISQLEECGITQYDFVPFYPGCKDTESDIQFAITAGEPQLVPSRIPNVLDIGNRIIDISTILQLCEYFNIPLQTVNRVSRNYVNQILHTVKTSETYYTNYVQTEQLIRTKKRIRTCKIRKQML